jgi:pantothenate synthetase
MWCVFQLQDVLGIDPLLRRTNPAEERINVPADPNNYWNYRMHIALEDLLNANGFKTEYISIAKANTMETIENIDSSESMVILVAAFLDGVRLIDNLTIA